MARFWLRAMVERKHNEQLSDRITMLVLFKALYELGFDTKRLKLEKLVYLAKVIGRIQGQSLTNQEFFVWHLGPFSKQVYADLESCVTHKWLSATPQDESDELGQRSFAYTITEQGIATANTAIGDPEFRPKYDLVLNVLQAIGPLSTEQIRRLSYGELDFRKAKDRGKKTVIDAEFPESLRLASLAKQVALEEFGLRLSDEEAAFLYLKLVETLAVRD
jgi:uncharacterized phage-associated protein